MVKPPKTKKPAKKKAEGEASSLWANSTKANEATFEERKHAVLLAAARLFSERGFDGGSFDELARRLNTSKPTIYYYVCSKEQCYFEICQRAQAPIKIGLRKAAELKGTGSDQLVAFLRIYIETVLTDFGKCLMRIGPAPLTGKMHKEIAESIKWADRRIMRIVKRGIEDGTLRDIDPTAMFYTVTGAINWTAMWYDASGPTTPAELTEKQLEILLNGIRT